MKRVGPYEIQGELARGGMGVVYRARDPRSGREVALKLLLTDGVNPVRRKRFAREAQAMVRLRHPGIVAVREVGEAHGSHPYLAMDLVEGRSLQERLDREGPLPVREAVERTIELADAVSHAHAQGVLHRDLKPDNVLERPDGRVVLTDFGLARDLDPSISQTQLTRDGRFLGTPGYWPPEQARGELDRIGPRADVYGLGATLYGLLTGEPPRGAETLALALYALERDVTPPARNRPEVDAGLERICLRCLAQDPEDRPASAAEVAEQLRRWLAGEPAGRGRGRWAGAALFVVAAGALAAALLPGPAQEEIRLETPPVAAESEPAVVDSSTAWDSLQALAGAGDSRAMTELGRRLAEGADVARDPIQAVTWFRRAAQAGFAPAMRRLGSCYAQGEGVERDPTQAVDWYRRSAEGGDRLAMVALGRCCLSGDGAKVDPLQAMAWYRRAAEGEQGLPEAMTQLGSCLVWSEGLEGWGQDPVQGVAWLRRAAEAGDFDGMTSLGSCLLRGQGVERDPARGVEWIQRAAEAGHVPAMRDLGNCYEGGQGVERDPARGMVWHRRAAETGDADSLHRVGLAYARGEGVERDPAQAVAWYRRAAEAGASAAMGDLGWCYLDAEGVERDAAQAVAWFRRGAEAEDFQALYALGSCYERGEGGLERDFAQATDCYRRSAKLGYGPAMTSLGRCYEQGAGLERDFAQAASWYRRAAQVREPEAMTSLARFYEQGVGVERDPGQAANWLRQAIRAGDVTQAPAALQRLLAKHPELSE